VAEAVVFVQLASGSVAMNYFCAKHSTLSMQMLRLPAEAYFGLFWIESMNDPMFISMAALLPN
jgi:hypothetical protein